MEPDHPGSIEDIASAFEQAPSVLIAVEGPDLTLVAWNAAGRRLAGPLVGSLGASIAENDFLRGSQLQELLLKVYTTGEPFTGSTWRVALPEADGEVREHFLDFTCAPWRWPDGPIRGVVAYAADITEQVLARHALESESARWEQRFRSSRETMRALQASLLPAAVPVVPGLQVGARYLLAEADTSAGGDWFSVVPLDGGRVALAVGDVVGHGLGAAATMGQLRAVLEERLQDGSGVVGSLQALERCAARIPGADATTVCVAILDPASGELEYCTAGHPPPLVVDGDLWRYLPLTGSGPLGSGEDYVLGRARLSPEALLLLYSDGLVERPDREWSESTAEIAQVVVHALAGRPVRPDAPTHAADRVCVQSVEQLTRTTGYDITVVAARRVRPAVPMGITLAGLPHLVVEAADEVERWLAAVDAGDEDQRDIRLALVELFTNSVEHGLRDRLDGQVKVTCRLASDGAAELVVADDGRWRESGGVAAAFGGGFEMAPRGLGLPLVGQLVDELHVEHDSTGTRVRLRRVLSRPASLLGEEQAARPLRRLDDVLNVSMLPGDPGTLLVFGPVLDTTAESLRTSLDVATHGGTQSTTVDLTGVTHLASGGVRVLQQTRRTSDREGVDLVLVAAPDSTAHHVLTLVGIPHATARPSHPPA